MIQSFSIYLRFTNFMLSLQPTENTSRMKFFSHIVNILLKRQLLQNHLMPNLVSTWRNIPLRQIKSYTDNVFNLITVSVIDPMKNAISLHFQKNC